MARKKQSEKNKETPVPDEIDIGAEIGLTQFQDEKYSSVQNKLPTKIPHLDYILGGGLPFGRMVEILGINSSGKSGYAVHLTKIAQELKVPVVWIDVEGTSESGRMKQLGVDPTPGNGVWFVQPETKKDKETGAEFSEEMNIERVADELKRLTKAFQKNKQPLVIIWDSVSQTPASKEIERGVGDSMPGIQAKALTQFSKIIAPMITDSQTLFIAINQARDDMGSMFGGIDSVGGNAFKHWASLRLEVKKASQIKDKTMNAFGREEESYIGHIVRFKSVKSKISRPQQQAEAYFMSDSGLDFEENVYRSALASNKQYGLISGGTWRKYIALDGAEIKFNSNRKWVDYLKSEEGHSTLVEIFGRMMATSFPNGYSPFSNKDVDITKIPIYKEIGEDYMNKYSPDKAQAPEEEKQPEVDDLLDEV